MLHRGSRGKNGWWYRAKAGDCRNCPLQERCVSASANSRSVLRARRRRRRWDEATRQIYTRHRWRVEGVHGEAKTRHGLRPVVRRGLANVAIEAYLTAAVVNLKRLAAFLILFLPKYVFKDRGLTGANPVWSGIPSFHGSELRLAQIGA